MSKQITSPPEQSTPTQGPVRTLLHGASATGIVNGLGAISTLAVGLVLARRLGAVGYGAYAFAMAWVEILALIAPLGFDKLLMREVAVGWIQERWSAVKGLLKFSWRITLVTSVLLSVVACLIVLLARPLLESALVPCLFVALLIPPLRGLIFRHRGVLLARHRVVAAALSVALLQPLLLLSFVFIFVSVVQKSLTPVWAVGLTAVAAFITLTIAWANVRCLIDDRQRQATALKQPRAWLGAALPMLLLATLTIIHAKTDLIMLGAMKGAAAAGIYSAALLLAQLTRFGAMAVNPALAPMAAAFDTKRDRLQFQRTAVNAARAMSGWSLLALIVLVIWGRPLLGLYGPSFVSGYHALVVLCAAYTLCSAMGAVETILMMTGNEKVAARIGLLAAGTNIALNAALIPPYGLEGAAYATGFSTLLWSMTLTWLVRRRLGINATVFSRC